MAKSKGHNWDKLYQNYSNKWDYWDKKLPNGMDQAKLSKRAFRDIYINIETSRLKEQELGIRKESLNVMRDMINKQKYGITKKQASVRTKAIRESLYRKIDSTKMSEAEFKKEMRKINKEITFKGIREGTIKSGEFWEDVKKYNEMLDTIPNLTKAEKRHIIANTFFGSP